MSDSAKLDDGGGLRERKRAATRAAITAAARSLTAGRGLHGYTVEELCEQVGISRRTFFNYFPTKEDALIGHFDDEVSEELVAAFLAGGKDSPAGTISPTLLQDLLEFLLGIASGMSMPREDIAQLIEVIGKEPQIMAKMVGASETREEDFAELIARREGVRSDHPMVQMATLLFGAIARKSSSQYFSPGASKDYRALLLTNVHAAVELFSQAVTAPSLTTPSVTTPSVTTPSVTTPSVTTRGPS
ncbi:TetR family transcriptional regulator [Paenarthrobacter sp. Z7-10]|uniref:TetR/AcrR family transcriptional regulator n=1 Tax=Paenarthrobacter sp. Z7-10 TaxID=2787635 RepID=UPI0022A8EB17|nr:TetR/AcrR family transcriptional regulator [Paenarthrobacter sp. Z7-10]MCZ2403237.1 TetR family transcriptional regulator [Paenarthrobacter sp. Z7-10]